MQFQVQLGDRIVGETDLEFGDPPMGVAFGKLKPSPTFELFRTEVDQDGFVRTSEPVRVCDQTGKYLTGQAISIQMHSVEGDGEELVVSILGMDGVDYERWFKNHIDAYEQKFR